VSNHFGLLENALCIKYKCYSSECVAEEGVPIGRLHARALVPLNQDKRRWQSAVVLELLHAGVSRQTDPESDGPNMALRDVLRYCNTYFAVVREPMPVVVEVVYRDAACLQVEEVFIRTQAEMKLLTENVRAVNPHTGKTASMDVVWRQSPDRREVVRMDFMPQHRETFVDTPKGTFLNTSPGFLVQYDPGFAVDDEVVEALLFHLSRGWARDLPCAYEYVLNFLADMLQHPERKIGVALLLFSQPGAGKNIILWFLGDYILGDLYVSLPSLKQVSGGFNAVLARRLLVNLDEVASSGDAAVNDRIKTMVTEPTNVIEKKGVDAVQAWLQNLIVV
jgi:hypothetical protein